MRKGLVEGLAKGEAKGLAKGEAKGLAKGKTKERNQIALNMMRSNISVELIAQFTGLNLKEIEKLQKLPISQFQGKKSK